VDVTPQNNLLNDFTSFKEIVHIENTRNQEVHSISTKEKIEEKSLAV
jgi:hypothetical protein